MKVASPAADRGDNRSFMVLPAGSVTEASPVRLRIVLAVLVVLLPFPAILASPVYAPPLTARLVEGHTVFAVVEAITGPLSAPSDTTVGALPPRVPLGLPTGGDGNGLRWSNDQDVIAPEFRASSKAAAAVLVREVVSDAFDTRVRHPCTGAVLAVNQHDPDPRAAFSWGGAPLADYVGSYLVTDVNDHTWNVDRWSWETGGSRFPIWTVAIGGLDEVINIPDDSYSNCSPFGDSSGAAATGENGREYSRFRYNALLVFETRDLTVRMADKDHRLGSGDRAADVAACRSSCPDGDVERQGNSHDFNPWAPHFTSRRDGATDDAVTIGVHATFAVEVYYGIADLPAARQYTIEDTDGSLVSEY